MFNLEYYNRYNQRIFVESTESGGTPITGAISDIVTSNLPANFVLVSSASGKIVSSSGLASKIANINDTTGPIQAQLDAKEGTLTKGNLTEVTSSVLTITGGTAAVIGSGLSIQVKQATGGQSGYLSSADWSAFNNKLPGTLADGKILVGDGGGLAQQRTPSGDISMSNLGVVTISNNAITNAKVHATAGIALSKLAATTPSRAVVTDGSGFLGVSSVTSSELALLSGLTGVALQTQLAGKLSATITSAAQGDIVYFDGSAWVNLARGSNGQILSSTATSIQWINSSSNVPAGGAAGDFLMKNSGTDYDTVWQTLVVSNISDITASVAQINELGTGYYDATSSVQGQLNAKLDKTLQQNYMFIGNASNIATALASGPDTYVLTSVSGVPTWVAPSGGGTVTSVGASGGTTGLSFTGSPITGSGTFTLTGTLNPSNGGTGQSSYTIGDILYASSTTALSKLSAGTSGYVLTSNGPGVAPSWQASAGGGGSAWLLASGGTLTGNNVITGTGFTLKGVWTGLGTTVTEGYGWWLANTTAASAGSQQISPSVVWEGQGWKTNAAAASQSVKFASSVLPVQGAANPSGLWVLSSSINGSGYSENISVDSTVGGILNIGGSTGIRIFSDGLAGLYIGHNAGNLSFLGSTQDNVGIGSAALGSITSGPGNVAIGANAGDLITTGSWNTLVGEDAGTHLVAQTGNTLIGAFHVDTTYDLGNYNTAVGYQCFFNSASTADENIAIGYQAGGNLDSGNQNVFIGSGTYVNSGTADGQLSIQNVIFGTGNIAKLTNVSTGSVGIGVFNPTARFHITQDDKSSGWQPAFRVSPGAHTSMTAATEFVSQDFATVSQQWLSGTVATQRFTYFRQPIVTGASATATFTNAYNVYIDTPVASTNAAITNRWALGLSGPLRITGLGTGTGTAFLLEDSGLTAKVTIRDDGSTVFNTTGTTDRFLISVSGTTAFGVRSSGNAQFGGGNDMTIGRANNSLAYGLNGATDEVFYFANAEDVDQYGMYFRMGTTQTATTGSTREYFVLDVNTLDYNSGSVAANAFGVRGTVDQQGTGLITWAKLNPTITDLDGDFIGLDINVTTPGNIAGYNLAMRATSGSILLNGTTKGANTGAGVLIVENAGTNALAAQANGIVLHARDSSDATSTLALYLEQAVEAIGTFTASHKFKIWVNGTEYWIQLDAV